MLPPLLTETPSSSSFTTGESVDLPSPAGSPLQQLQAMIQLADERAIFSSDNTSSFLQRIFIRTFTKPRVLSSLFPNLAAFSDFLAIIYSCKTMRDFADIAFEVPEVKHAAFLRFVPGYPAKIPHWNTDVRMGLPDLEMFLESNHMPLHRYPAHALALLSNVVLTGDENELSSRLTYLALGHSRFVLFLRPRELPTNPIHDEEDLAWQWDRFDSSGFRDLIFPAPLSYFPMEPVKQDAAAATSQLTFRQTAKLRRRLLPFSLKGKRPPPPDPAPAAVHSYWRHKRALSMQSPFSSPELTPTTTRIGHRRFLSQTETTLPSFSTPSPQPQSSPSSLSTHDISRVFNPFRAPVIRVFVPCSVLDENVIAACEDQLITSSLWGHLVFGDIICNLGYIPNEEESDFQGWMIFTGFALMRFSSTTPFRDGPWILPSPSYFSNIMSPLHNLFITLGLPRFRLLSPLATGHPRLTLTKVTTSVPSPTSWSRQAKIQTYAWVTQVLVVDGVSPGWQGEWTLQVDGTPEGRSHLLRILSWKKEYGPHFDRWEVLRDKTSGGKIWLKLANQPVMQLPLPLSLLRSDHHQ